MDLPDVKRIMLSEGIWNDPAWKNANISIRPIPCFRKNDCPLGLYFPIDEYVPQFGGVVPAHTIVIPPNSNKGVVLHELGHHHGLYYYHNLSEEYAQHYRFEYDSEGLPPTVAACGSRDCCCECHHNVRFTENEGAPECPTNILPWVLVPTALLLGFAVGRSSKKGR